MGASEKAAASALLAGRSFRPVGVRLEGRHGVKMAGMRRGDYEHWGKEVRKAGIKMDQAGTAISKRCISGRIFSPKRRSEFMVFAGGRPVKPM